MVVAWFCGCALAGAVIGTFGTSWLIRTLVERNLVPRQPTNLEALRWKD